MNNFNNDSSWFNKHPQGLMPKFTQGLNVVIDCPRYMLISRPDLNALTNKRVTILDWTVGPNNSILYTCMEYPDIKIPENCIERRGEPS